MKVKLLFIYLSFFCMASNFLKSRLSLGQIKDPNINNYSYKSKFSN